MLVGCRDMDATLLSQLSHRYLGYLSDLVLHAICNSQMLRSRYKLPQDEYKTIAQEQTNKVLMTLPNSGIGGKYDTASGVAEFMTSARKEKIISMVENYMHKYQK